MSTIAQIREHGRAIAMVDTETVEFTEKTLEHKGGYRPDITLMDLRLPGTDGTDALIAIRGEFPQARIIMLTTSDGDGDIQRAMEQEPRAIS